MHERPAPFELHKLLQDHGALLSRLELAFALERPKRVVAPPRGPRVNVAPRRPRTVDPRS